MVRDITPRLAARRQLSAGEDGFVGAFVGAAEVLLMQPTVYWKTELQQQRFTLNRALNPLYAYRGIVISCVSIAPITAISFSSNGAYLRSYSALSGRPASDGIVMGAGVLAGATAALVQSPCQLIEINQQKHGGSLLAMAQRVVGEYGFLGLYKAYSMTAVREGVFCCSIFSAMPLCRRYLKEWRPEMPESAATGLAGVLAAGPGAALTHPADTLKTRLQGGIFPAEPGGPVVNTSVRAALAEMRANGSVFAQCYGGFVPRVLRIISCTYIYDFLRDKTTGYITESR